MVWGKAYEGMIGGASRRCWANVDLAALERNVGRIKAALPEGTKYISVVKADAYGHGLPQVVPRLMQSHADGFAVANVQEAAKIRELGSGWPILVLSPILPEEDSYLLEYDLTATVSTIGEVDRFEKLGCERGKEVRVQMKVDTGMGRLGVWYSEAKDLYNRIRGTEAVKFEGIYTHFPVADSDPAFTQVQRERFLGVVKQLGLDKREDLLIHADNSAGIDTFNEGSVFNAVRVGLLQLGVLPNPDMGLKTLGVEAVLSLKSRIGLIKELPEGETVSYGRTYKMTKRTKLGIVTAGYGDGVDMGLSNKGEVLIRGLRYPVVGRVTMDLIMVDLMGDSEIQVGDEVTLIGQDGDECIDIAQWSAWGETIEWDIYCSITKRVPRVYLNDVFS